MLRKNDITTEDSLFSTDETTFTHLMYDVDELKSETAFPRTDQNSQMVFNNIYMVQQYGIKHVRQVYDLLDLFGDLGGVFEVFKTIILMFILPISEHIFILRTLKRLFYVKTRDENLFKNVKSNWDN